MQKPSDSSHANLNEHKASKNTSHSNNIKGKRKQQLTSSKTPQTNPPSSKQIGTLSPIEIDNSVNQNNRNQISSSEYYGSGTVASPSTSSKQQQQELFQENTQINEFQSKIFDDDTDTPERYREQSQSPLSRSTGLTSQPSTVSLNTLTAYSTESESFKEEKNSSSSKNTHTSSSRDLLIESSHEHTYPHSRSLAMLQNYHRHTTSIKSFPDSVPLHKEALDYEQLCENELQSRNDSTHSIPSSPTSVSFVSTAFTSESVTSESDSDETSAKNFLARSPSAQPPLKEDTHRAPNTLPIAGNTEPLAALVAPLSAELAHPPLLATHPLQS